VQLSWKMRTWRTCQPNSSARACATPDKPVTSPPASLHHHPGTTKLARVYTGDQDAQLQHDALTAAGCYRIFTDTSFGALQSRPELDKLLDQLRPGDTLVVWRLDRLGRSIRHLIDHLSELQDRGIEFRSLQENIDTTTSGGRLVFHIFASLAEFERDLIRERTNAGLAAVRARGRTGGRPRLLTKEKLATARNLYNQQDMTVAQIGDILGVSRSTIYRALQRDQISIPDNN